MYVFVCMKEREERAVGAEAWGENGDRGRGDFSRMQESGREGAKIRDGDVMKEKPQKICQRKTRHHLCRAVV